MGSAMKSKMSFRRRILKNMGMVMGAGMLVVSRAAITAGLRRRDGWRRAAGMVLREPGASFVLSAFGLDAWHGQTRPQLMSAADVRAHIASRLRTFLESETAFHVRIERGEHCDRPIRHDGPSYSLAFAPAVDGPPRFVPPDDWAGQDGGDDPSSETGSLFGFVCRADERGRTDVWVRVNHVGADGAPVQEMMNRLESAWGGSQVIYPTPAQFAPYEFVRDCACRPKLGLVQAFVDFEPLLAWRKRENARLPEVMTVSAAVLWWLARHERFRTRRMATMVDIPETSELGRGVAAVVLRPGDFFDRPDALAMYVRRFNREVERSRRRVAKGCRMLDAAAFVPPGPARDVICHALRREKAFGTMGLTTLRDAKVFVTPIGDVGHRDGFIAVGSMTLPTESGTVGCVTIKGPRERIAEYPRIVREALAGVPR